MHTDRLDRLSRLLGTFGTRRSALGALMGMAVLAIAPGGATTKVEGNEFTRFVFARPTGPTGPIGLPGQNCAEACLHVCQLGSSIFLGRCVSNCRITCRE